MLYSTNRMGSTTVPVASVGVSPTDFREQCNVFGDTPKPAGGTPALPTAPTPIPNAAARLPSAGTHQRPGGRARPRHERNRHRQQTRYRCDEENAGRRFQTPLATAHQDG